MCKPGSFNTYLHNDNDFSMSSSKQNKMFKICSIILLSKFLIVQCVSIKEIISREVVCPQDLEYTDDEVSEKIQFMKH